MAVSSSRRVGGWTFVFPFGSGRGGGDDMASRKAEMSDMTPEVTSLKVWRCRISMASVVAVEVQYWTKASMFTFLARAFLSHQAMYVSTSSSSPRPVRTHARRTASRPRARGAYRP